MDLLREAKKGSRIFKITFPSGEQVFFRLLPWKDFNAYWELSLKKTIPADVLEGSIFRQCVVGDTFLDEPDSRRAGVVPTVAAVAMKLSGLADPENFTTSMDIVRQHVDSINSQIVMIICRAFPAYKPEDIEKMPWPKVLARLAQAERILMKSGELTEPLAIVPMDQFAKQKSNKVNVEDLVKDAAKMREVDRVPTRGPSLRDRIESGELTPQQQQQIQAIENLKRRRNH